MGYLLTPGEYDQESCVIPISPVPDDGNMAIFGDTFMRNFYTSFNFSNNKVGIAVNSSSNFGAKVDI